MESTIHGEMADQQTPLDYGVQIRFIDDLKAPKKTRSRASKQSTYGVAVRVQGIDGQPFVVLNSGDKSKSSYGVQIKTESSYANPPPDYQSSASRINKPVRSISSESDLPENPYATKGVLRNSLHYSSTSDEEQNIKPRDKAKLSGGSSSRPRPLRASPKEELRRSQSQSSLLDPEIDDTSNYGQHYSERSSTFDTTYSNLSQSRSSSSYMNNGAHTIGGYRSTTGLRSTSSTDKLPLQKKDSLPSSALPNLPREDIDTKPLSSVDSLISKFDVKGQVRGRTARRSRIQPEERKRSQSLDGRVSYRDSADSREIQASGFQEQSRTQVRAQPANNGSFSRSSLNREPLEREQFNKTELTNDWLNHTIDEPVIQRKQQNTIQSGIQLKSTPDLLKDQQTDGTDPTRDMIYSILRDGSSDNENTLRKKTNLILEKIQSYRVSPGDDTRTLVNQKKELERKVAELQRQLDDEVKQRIKLETLRPKAGIQKLEIQLEESMEECNRLKDLFEKKKTELNTVSQELMEVRMGKEQVETKLRSMEDQLLDAREEISQLQAKGGAMVERHVLMKDQLSLESERQKINLVVKNLQRELEESSDEINQWKEMFQKNKDELRSAKQEVLQLKMEKEEFEDELREMRDRFSLMQSELNQVKRGSVDAGEADAIKKELQRAKDQLSQVTLEKQRQEQSLHQQERELSALKGVLKEEVSDHDRETEKLREQFQKESRQIRKDYEQLVKSKETLESEKAESERLRQVLENNLQEAREENDDLRRKILGLEAQVKELKTFCDDLQRAETRLKDNISKLEAKRKRMEETLGEVTDQEQEYAMMKRSLESRLEEAQRSLSRLTLEYDELQECYQEEMRQKDQLKKTKNELEEQKRLLDKSMDKLTKELDNMSSESRYSLQMLQNQLEEYKEKSRREISEAQKQAKERLEEAEKTQFSTVRLQEEIQKLKQALQESQAERESALLDKELVSQRLQSLEQDIESKKRYQDDRSRQVKVLEDKMKRLEVELDEEKNTVELLTDRVNRSREQMDQLRSELMQERSSRQDLECDKISLERQNKDLKNRLASMEGQQKPNVNVSQLEAKLQEVQDRLQSEEREKTGLLSSNRKLERKLKELNIQLEDDRLQVNDQKDQLNLRVKALKRQVDEAEEEIERLEGLRKKAVRDLEEQHEINEQLQARLKTMEKETKRKPTRPAIDDDLSSDGEFDAPYDPSSIASLLTESNLQTSSC
ncbi:cingulin isoform X2 [Bombina bombina]|uniref:cingulin isoform X2 n=1 Tax=Bombina bombina TaxID=8345 RepID=UPI00235AF8D2|nr:cingulin isoform X2 [Bombina bombina]